MIEHYTGIAVARGDASWRCSAGRRGGSLGRRRRGTRRPESSRRQHDGGHAGLPAGEPVPPRGRADATRRPARRPGLEPGQPVPGDHAARRRCLPPARRDLDRADEFLAHALDVATRGAMPPVVPVELAERASPAFTREDWTAGATLPIRRGVRARRRARPLLDQRPRVRRGGPSHGHPRGSWSGGGSSSHGPLGCGRCSRTPCPLNRPRPCRVARATSPRRSRRCSGGPAASEGHLPAAARARRLPARQADELRARVETIRAEGVGASSLTTAELRLLPLLRTHLTLGEISRTALRLPKHRQVPRSFDLRQARRLVPRRGDRPHPSARPVRAQLTNRSA